MKNWSVKKKIKPDTINDTNAPGTDRSATASSSESISGLSLSHIIEEPASEDFYSDVEFDVLTSHDSQYVTTGGTSHDAILSGIYYL
jgi:hypothetical protein